MFRFLLQGEHVRGSKTLDENIADFGGVRIAYSAYLTWYNETVGGEPTEASRRLFFVSFGQNWCNKERAKSVKMNTLNDGKSIQVLRMPGGTEAFPVFEVTHLTWLGPAAFSVA